MTKRPLNHLIYRVYPVWDREVPKDQRHNNILGLVYATSEEDAMKRALDGAWHKTYDGLKNFKGTYKVAC